MKTLLDVVDAADDGKVLGILSIAIRTFHIYPLGQSYGTGITRDSHLILALLAV